MTCLGLNSYQARMLLRSPPCRQLQREVRESHEEARRRSEDDLRQRQQLQAKFSAAIDVSVCEGLAGWVMRVDEERRANARGFAVWMQLSRFAYVGHALHSLCVTCMHQTC